MSSQHQAATDHPVARLLPWYLSGTLKESDRRAVDQHLATCADCRRELDELTALRAPLKDAFTAEPMPSRSIKASVMAQIQAARAAGPRSTGDDSPRRVGEAVEQWFRNLFGPRWVPTLAAALLIGQLALLLWTAGQQSPVRSDTVTTRGIPGAPVRVVVVFQESASEARMRAVIQTLQGRLVDGPTTDGRYTIEVGPSAVGVVEAQLQALRQQTDVIRRAERLAP